MSYNFDFDIASVIILLIVLIFYWNTPKVKNLANRMY